MASFEFLAIIFTGLGLAASIVYYANILNNANKTRELQLTAQQQSLETRQTQLYMDIYKSLLDPQFGEAHRLVMLSEWNTTQDFLNDYGWYNKELEYTPMLRAIDYMSALYEGVGVLVREELIDVRTVALLFSGVTRTTWEKLEPIVFVYRERLNYPQFAKHFEYLYNRIKEYMKKHPEFMK